MLLSYQTLLLGAGPLTEEFLEMHFLPSPYRQFLLVLAVGFISPYRHSNIVFV